MRDSGITHPEVASLANKYIVLTPPLNAKSGLLIRIVEEQLLDA